MKLIALDVGTKRIGVAKADSAVRIAVPYSAIEVDGNEFNKIASLARAWDINCFVIGLPRNNQGEETNQSLYVREFAKVIKRTIPDAKICFQDESLTSVEAEKRLKNRKKGYKKGDIDSEAATIILQDFLEQKGGKVKPKNKTKASTARNRSVKANKPNRFFSTLLVLLVLLGLAAGGAYFYYQQGLQAVFTDIDCEDPENTGEGACKPVVFAVESGAGISEVANELESAGLIRSSIVFQVYYRLNHGDATIKVGEYDLLKTMTVEEIVTEIVSGKGGNVFSFTVFPGETTMDIRRKLIDCGYNEAEINAALRADYSKKPFSWIFDGRPSDASLEGYLLGDTYEFYVGEEVENIFSAMMEAMAEQIKDNDLIPKFASHGLNLYQGITLASVVQKEANNTVDYAKVAQVFYNRIAAGISLGSDVTVQYAVDLVDPNREIYTNNLLALDIDSPYNTRKYPGLPYGPISNPGIDALLSTATPDESMSNHLFFLTGDDGVMYYSITEDEHNANIHEHCQELCAVAL